MDTELEHGSYVPKPRRRHNGYYAGDFSQTAPMPWEQLRRVMELGQVESTGVVYDGPDLSVAS